MATLDIAATEQAARKYLSEQLGERAPQSLALARVFEEQPLEGEGETALFSFELAPGPGVMATAETAAAYEPEHYVAAGQTEPNFFPAYGFDAEQAYSFHVGTRFMLGMNLQLADAELEPPGAREQMRKFVAAYAKDQSIEQEELAVLFRSDDASIGVYKLRLSGESYYCMGIDCPPGFYPVGTHPPQVPLRLHLGRLIRNEARAADTDAREP